jgi:putative glutamine amidotransferase
MKPLVLVNGNFEKDSAVLQATYFDAVREAGGVPLLLPAASAPDEEEVRSALRAARAVLLVGGFDYDPAAWGETRHPRAVPIHERRDRFDPFLARLAIEARVPALGLCAGCQALQIAAGGALIQHLGSDDARSPHAEGSRHGCRVEPGSVLARALGGERFGVNSFHHQAVDPGRLGAGFRVSAWAEPPIRRKRDGGGEKEEPFVASVEAIEAADGAPVLGVQWHPERMLSEPAGLPLFRWLVQQAAHV